MKVAAGLALALAAFGGARFAREAAGSAAPDGRAHTEEPYAPSPAVAPIVTLGFRELTADLLWVRLRGYFGSRQSTANGVASLAETIVALDPRYHVVYEYGANAMTIATTGVNQSTYLRATALPLAERGTLEFRPTTGRFRFSPARSTRRTFQSSDPVQQRAVGRARHAAHRSPRSASPARRRTAATWAAFMRTKFGQHDRAVSGLREMLLVTSDAGARKRIIDKLAELEDANADEIGAEIYEERAKFETTWHRDRPMIRPSMYILLGPHIVPGFDLTDLATGGADLVGSEPVEKLEPLE